MDIVKFEERHIKVAAELFVQGYKALRSEITFLPEQHESIEEVSQFIAGYIKEQEGVVAIEKDCVVGYMLGYKIPKFISGHKGIYMPVWSHCTTGTNRREVYGELYKNEDVTIKLATVEEEKALSMMSKQLHSYMNHAPIFMPLQSEEEANDYQEFFKSPDNKAWVALIKEEAVGYMQIEKSSDGATHLVSDVNSFSITGAFTRPEFRGFNIGKALLNEIMSWAKDNQKSLCSVDFESFNLQSSRFWLKHFKPVCYSYVRVIDDQISY